MDETTQKVKNPLKFYCDEEGFMISTATRLLEKEPTLIKEFDMEKASVLYVDSEDKHF